jgi:hypothetical protein
MWPLLVGGATCLRVVVDYCDTCFPMTIGVANDSMYQL